MPRPSPRDLAVRLARSLTRPDTTGVLVAAWFFGQSLGPSLLLRSWLHQGVLAGVAVVLGYWLGLGVATLVRAGWPHTRWTAHPSAEAQARVRGVVLLVALAYAGVAVARAVPQHRWTWERLGHEPASFTPLYVGTLGVAAGVAALLLVVGRLFHLARRRLTPVAGRFVPAWMAGAVALVVLTWALVTVLNDVALQRTLDAANTAFTAADVTLRDAPEPPTSSLRSGGPGSVVDWARTGHEGRRFLTRGPTQDDVADLSVGRATEPVRVYVGRAEADTPEERVATAVEELERTRAFDRDALLVVVPTGTGWVNEQLVQPLEYFHDGSIATVALQYSHLPSPLAFLSEQEAAGATARELVEALERRLAGHEDPPALYVAGESLGSFGGAAAFESLEDSAERVDGAVWVGPPASMSLRREAERTRQPGSLQIRPVVGDGDEFVFVNRARDLADLPPRRRVHSVFLQQADDPVVWWDWDVALTRPDWLAEPLDAAVNPELEWTPVTTFLQLAVDMAVSNDFDEEHGHLYGTLPLTAWHAVVRPDGWDAARVEELRARLSAVNR